MTDAAIDGRPASLDDAFIRAAEILRTARRPLFEIGSYTTLEAQRAAVLLAQRLGGVIGSDQLATSLFPDIGSVTCSLGEVQNRADLVIFWHGNSAENHLEILTARGRFHDGGGQRTLVTVGEQRSAPEPRFAKHQKCDGGSTFAALWLLRALARGKSVPDSPVGGTSLADWAEFIAFVKSHRFVVFVLDGSSDPRVIEAAHGLALDLQADMRCYAITLSRDPNPLGLQFVLATLGGMPIGAHDECDAVLSVGQKPLDSMDAQRLSPTPQISISTQTPGPGQDSSVWINSAACGEADSGHAIRFDGICVPWRAVSLASVPNDFAVLNRLANQLRPA